jgi:1-acyl-sn-glycerol-3-phosphate acyltransferase
MKPVAMSAIRMPAYVLYGLYAWIAFAVLALLALLGAVLLPTLPGRRAFVGGMARLIMRVLGLPLEVRGLEHLPNSACVVVANHASYLDGLVMKAALPTRFSFVVKREMDRVPLAGLLLRRIGTEFVERFDRHKGASDARRVMRSAANGQALVFFPEGTFSEQVGLLKFHSGAFAIAARNGSPVVPCVIRGTRDALPSNKMLPRPGRITVELRPPIPAPASDDAHAAARLRDAARAEILRELGEPDLTTQAPAGTPAAAPTH